MCENQWFFKSAMEVFAPVTRSAFFITENSPDKSYQPQSFLPSRRCLSRW